MLISARHFHMFMALEVSVSEGGVVPQPLDSTPLCPLPNGSTVSLQAGMHPPSRVCGASPQSLTSRVVVGLQHGCGALHAVDDAQQGASEPKQLAEAVEAKVDEVVCQADHLRGERAVSI